MKLQLGTEIKIQGKYIYHSFVLGIGLLVYFITNTYFGWNETAQSGAERVCDFIWNTLCFIGILGLFVENIIYSILENYVNIEIDALSIDDERYIVKKLK